MDADTSEKIRDVISFVHSRTLSIGVYSPGDISATDMYGEAASELEAIIQQEIAKAKLNGALRGYACESDEQFDELLAELSKTLKTDRV